jgi:hypothetical protein
VAKRQKKEKAETIASPVGTLVYAFLNQARDYNDNGEFAYSTSLLARGQDAADFMKLIDGLMTASQAQFDAKKLEEPPYEPYVDRDNKAHEGVTRFKFKVKTGIETSRGIWNRKPYFLDAALKPCAVEPMIGEGTEARVAFQVYNWQSKGKAGITLQPIFLQIVKLVEYQPHQISGEEVGFTPIDGGYTAPEAPESSDDGEFDEASDADFS